MAKDEISKLNLVTTNIRSENLKGELSLIYSDRLCILVGIDHAPHSLFANNGFKLQDYAPELRRKISDSRGVLLRPYQAFDIEERSPGIILPDWLTNLEEIKILTLEGGLIDNKGVLSKLPINTLVFDYLPLENKKVVLKEILRLNNLNYLVYKEMDIRDIFDLQQQLPKVNILQKAKYELMVNQRIIKFD